MTHEEALIECGMRFLEAECGSKEENLFYTCMNAIKKQMPKKPINWLGKMLICPRCNRADYIKPLESYCKFCGQRLDLGDEE